MIVSISEDRDNVGLGDPPFIDILLLERSHILALDNGGLMALEVVDERNVVLNEQVDGGLLVLGHGELDGSEVLLVLLVDIDSSF